MLMGLEYQGGANTNRSSFSKNAVWFEQIIFLLLKGEENTKQMHHMWIQENFINPIHLRK